MVAWWYVAEIRVHFLSFLFISVDEKAVNTQYTRRLRRREKRRGSEREHTLSTVARYTCVLIDLLPPSSSLLLLPPPHFFLLLSQR